MGTFVWSRWTKKISKNLRMDKLEESKEQAVTAVAIATIGFVVFKLIQSYARGPTKGTDNLKRLDGKYAAITGATHGIGVATALELSRRGANVILLCRNTDLAAKVGTDIQSETGHKVFVVKCDLASMDSVRECAEEIKLRYTRLDLLINNAGVADMTEQRTEDGFELQIGVNHFGHFLLTELLVPIMKKTVEQGNHNPRIVILSSNANSWGKIRFNDINYTEPGSYPWGLEAYGQSKLANVMHAAALARRLEGTGITTYSVHPGSVKTNVGKHMEKNSTFVWLMGRTIGPILGLFFKTPFYGAQTTLYTALEEKLEKESGHYYTDCKRSKPNPIALVVEDQERLWRLSSKMVELK